MSDRATVLIVDDDPALLDALPVAVQLRMPGLAIHRAGSAAMALAEIARYDYDAIVTDIKMPGMDGLGLLAEIRALRPETPTLLISGHGEHDLTIQALRGGAYDFIQKPIDRDYFMAALERALQTRALRREVAAQRLELERHAANLEATVAERTRELKIASEAKDEFLGMISHEMRTPLTLIGGGVQLLRMRKDDLSAESREALLVDIELETARLTRIVEDLLVLAHTQLGEATQAEPVSLNALVQRVVDSARRHVSREVVANVDPELPPVAAAETYVERVLTNLISNAAKYSQPGAPVYVFASAGPGDTVVVRVVDAGPGVTESELDSIWDRFFRSRGSATRAPGVGMGLTVCRRLVEAMSGQTWARHVDGGGFEVGFSLPAWTPEPEAEGMLAGRAG